MSDSAERFMRLAIAEARKNIKTGEGGPFGACIVKNGRVISVARNTVLCADATCHAEVNAIRLASRKLKCFDLSGCEIYTTTEPCPMCFSAIHWARIDTIIYGTTIRDAARIGFNEFRVSCRQLIRLGKSPIKLKRTALVRECRKLFSDWYSLPDKQLY